MDYVRYMAPEVILSDPDAETDDYDVSVDMYAFGMMMLELVTLREPYGECKSLHEIVGKITGGALGPRGAQRGAV